VAVLGHALEVRKTVETFEQRSGILFVGAVHEEESPNGDSLIWFLSEVWPLISHALGGAIPFTIVGVNRSERIRSMAAAPVRLVGSVPDLSSLYGASRVFVAPTRYAAGMPHKIHEAASRGLPVVGTSLLASQLTWTTKEMAIADTAADFAARVVELYRNAGQWQALRDAAFERVSEECSEQKFRDSVRLILSGASVSQAKLGQI
jgi:glycosyltransferase involved in cell wall biosynthesis